MFTQAKKFLQSQVQSLRKHSRRESSNVPEEIPEVAEDIEAVDVVSDGEDEDSDSDEDDNVQYNSKLQGSIRNHRSASTVSIVDTTSDFMASGVSLVSKAGDSLTVPPPREPQSLLSANQRANIQRPPPSYLQAPSSQPVTLGQTYQMKTQVATQSGNVAAAASRKRSNSGGSDSGADNDPYDEEVRRRNFGPSPALDANSFFRGQAAITPSRQQAAGAHTAQFMVAPSPQHKLIQRTDGKKPTTQPIKSADPSPLPQRTKVPNPTAQQIVETPKQSNAPRNQFTFIGGNQHLTPMGNGQSGSSSALTQGAAAAAAAAQNAAAQNAAILRRGSNPAPQGRQTGAQLTYGHSITAAQQPTAYRQTPAPAPTYSQYEEDMRRSRGFRESKPPPLTDFDKFPSPTESPKNLGSKNVQQAQVHDALEHMTYNQLGQASAAGFAQTSQFEQQQQGILAGRPLSSHHTPLTHAARQPTIMPAPIMPMQNAMGFGMPQMPQQKIVIGKWAKGELIGQGATGRVYLGYNFENGQFFAVKEITFANVPGDVLDSKLQALQREISLMKGLFHDNIVQYYGAETFGTTLNIFLEYVPGGSLASLVARFGRLSEEVARQYARQILLGLQYLHQNRIAHRDIKGANVLVSVDGIVKLADFGAGREVADVLTATGDGFKSLLGTPHFMAPEVIMQTGHERPADIWSLGCTVIEMITGKPPFVEYTTAAAVMFHIASTNDPPSMPEYLSPPCKDFLKLCFVRDAGRRPTADDLLVHDWLRDVVTPVEARRQMMNMMQQYQQMSQAPTPKNGVGQQQQQFAPGALAQALSQHRPDSSDTSDDSSSSSVESSPSNTVRTRPTSGRTSQQSTQQRRSPASGESSPHSGHLPLHLATSSINFNPVEEPSMTPTNSSLLGRSYSMAYVKPEKIEFEKVPFEPAKAKKGYDSEESIKRFLARRSQIMSKSMSEYSMKLIVGAYNSSKARQQQQQEETGGTLHRTGSLKPIYNDQSSTEPQNARDQVPASPASHRSQGYRSPPLDQVRLAPLGTEGRGERRARSAQLMRDEMDVPKQYSEGYRHSSMGTYKT